MNAASMRLLHRRRGDLLALGGVVLFVLLMLWKILLTNQILVGLDLFTYFYPYRDYVARTLRAGHLPLWNPTLFCGAPLLANPQSAVLYPLHWPLLWLAPPKMIAWSMALHLWLAGTFAYAYGRRSLQLAPLAALGGALALVGSGFLGAEAEQINQLNVTAWLPLALLLLDEAVRRAGRRWARATVLLGVTVALQFLAGHTQAFYINMVALGIRAVWPGLPWAATTLWSAMARTLGARRSPMPKRQPPWGRLLARGLLTYGLAALLGLGLAGAQLLPTLELSHLSVRGGGLPYRQAVSFSLNPRLLLLTLLPTFGDEDLFGEHIGYLGILALGLALVGLVARPCRRRRGFLACLALLGLALALGGYNPLYRLLYRVVPGIALFRAPGRWLALYTFGGAMMVGLGLQQLGQEERHALERLRRWLPRVGFACLMTLAIALVMSSGPVALLASPTVRTLLVWGGLGLGAAILLWLGLRPRATSGSGFDEPSRVVETLRPTGLRPRIYRPLLILALAGELWVAGQKLPYGHPTAPEAYAFLQPSLAFLRTDQDLYRFISVIDPQFDPGNSPDIRAIFSDQLSPQALYDYTVAAKWKATLERNLPLRYGVGSVDGYDGGVLPLKPFLDVQRLFLPEERILTDGRLRERLERIPDGQLLSLLNVKYAITDKVHDVWSEDIYYDLAHEAVLEGEEEVEPSLLPDFPAMSLGVISFLQGAGGVAQGTPVAELTYTGSAPGRAGDRTQRFQLLAGVHTAEGRYVEDQVAHSQPQVASEWPKGNGVDYVARVTWGEPLFPRQLIIRSLLPRGRLHVRGLTLIDNRVGTFEPVIVSTSGHYRLVHSGALKIYENLKVLPRAFFVPDVAPTLSLSRLWETGGAREVDGSHILSYAPERVVVQVEADQPGTVVLTDAFYPGWRATLDGREVPILRAEPYFRAVGVEAGQHRVEFTYHPLSLRLGVILSGLSVLIALLGLGWGGCEVCRSVRDGERELSDEQLR